MEMPERLIESEAAREREIVRLALGAWTSQSAKDLASGLARLAVCLQMAEPNKHRLYHELDRLGMQFWKADLCLKAAERDLMSVGQSAKQASSLKLKCGRMTEHIPAASSQRQALASCTNTVERSLLMSEENKRNVSSLQAELDRAGFESSLSHSCLLREAEDINAADEELAELDSKLAAFQDLPDDISAAEERLAQIKGELRMLRSEASVRDMPPPQTPSDVTPARSLWKYY